MSNTEPEEVNLMEILAAFYAALKRNYILSILLPLLGIAGAILFSQRSGDIFESSLLIETSLITENESQFLFDQLDKLGIIPGLTPQQDNQVNKLTFKVMRNDRSPELNEKSLYLQVTARVYDRKIFRPLEDALVHFINSSSPVVRHRSERQKFYDELIRKIDHEIAAMDDVKEEISSKIQATYLNPSELYIGTIELFREKMKLEIKRDEIKTVHLIKGFDTLTIDKKPNLIIMGAIGFVAGFMILCFVLFVKFFASYYKTYKITH